MFKRHYLAIISASALIAGTCIGAGMLAIPISTGAGGFWPGVVASVSSWLFMLLTGLYLLEVSRWMPPGSHLLSMSERYLGVLGKWITGAAFIFLYYCLLIGYFSISAPLVGKIIDSVVGIEIPLNVTLMLVCVVFMLVVYQGFRTVDKVNQVFLALMIISFTMVCVVGVDSIDSANLERADWSCIFLSAPVLFSALGFHNVIPSLCFVMGGNVRVIRWSIFWGTLTPLLVYIIWQLLVVGTLPADSFDRELGNGDSVISVLHFMEVATSSPWIVRAGVAFAFFAVVTSLLGVSFAMVDFVADGLKWDRWGRPRLTICLLVFLPPTLFAMVYPGIFLKAISTAGGIGESVLNGFVPVALLWSGVYSRGESVSLGFLASKPVLVLLSVYTTLIFLLELRTFF